MGELVTDIHNKRVATAEDVPRDPYLTGNPFFLERYCSVPCKERAFALWHRCLCGAKFVRYVKFVVLFLCGMFVPPLSCLAPQ